MDSLDLTKRAPRGPRQQLDGLYMMPRTIDKLRALLPGGNSGVYHMSGTSVRLLEAIGVTEAELLDVVAKADSDDDVARWLREHANRSAYDEVNRRLSTRRYEDVADKERFDSEYPVRAKLGLDLIFDCMEADDRERFMDAAP